MSYAKVTTWVTMDDGKVSVECADWAPTAQVYLGLTVPVSEVWSIGIQGSYRFRRASMNEGTLLIDGSPFQTIRAEEGEEALHFDLSGPVVGIVLGSSF